MSGHSHEDHHSTEQKPVSFTVPFILAAVTVLIVVLFLSLCDPKAHHAGEHGHAAAATEMHHDGAATEHHEAAAQTKKVVTDDSLAVESTVPSASAPEHK